MRGKLIAAAAAVATPFVPGSSEAAFFEAAPAPTADVAMLTPALDHLKDCMDAYASLPTTSPTRGESIRYLSPHFVKIGIRPARMDQVRPDCVDVDSKIARDTDIGIYKNGRRVGGARDMLRPSNDDGRPLSRAIRMRGRKMKVGDRVTAKFVTHAVSKNPALTTSDTDKIHMRIVPR